MSSREVRRLVCYDESGEAEHPARWTVRVSLNGEAWEKDLCDSAAARAERAFAPFMRAARPVSREGRPVKRPMARRRRAAAIRAWAREQGLAVSDRGRIADSVVAQYEAAQAGVRHG